MLTSLNNYLVCTPLEKAYNEPVAAGKGKKLLLNKTSNALEPVTVLVHAHVVKDGYEGEIPEGSVVYLPADIRANRAIMTVCTCPEVTKEVEVDGNKVQQPVDFILVPFDMVRMVKAN